jgi:alpha-glucuronidase
VLREDYVMRMVRQLADALARIAGLRKAGLLAQAEAELDAALASVGGIDPRLAAAADRATLLALVQDPARREAVARLLDERDAIRAARG